MYEEDIKPTRALKEAVQKYGLKKIHTGSLSYKDNRYLKSKPVFDGKAIKDHLSEKCFVIVFNHFEPSHSCWTSWETPYMDYAAAEEIFRHESARRLWDSRNLFFEKDGLTLNLMLV